MSSLPELTEPQIRRYARHIVLAEIGGVGQSRLIAARVLVVGAGGLGAPVLEYLAAAGADSGRHLRRPADPRHRGVDHRRHGSVATRAGSR
jgi:molybdopterin/thiamine biosynthesis adenylyltransferase